MNKFLSLFLLLWSLNAFSQNAKLLDSLLLAKNQYTKTDTTRVNLLIRLSRAYFQTDLEKSLDVANEALALATQIKQPLFLGKAYATQAVILMYNNQMDSAFKSYDRALAIFTKNNIVLERLNTLNNLGVAYVFSKNDPKARETYEKVVEEAEKNGFKKLGALALCNIGNVYNRQSEFNKAIGYFERGIKIFRELNDKHNVARNIGNIAVSYNRLGDYQKALDYYFECVKSFEEIKDYLSLGDNILNIATIYSDLEDWDNHIKYNQKALEIFRITKSKADQARSLDALALGNNASGKYQKALEWGEQGLTLAMEVKDQDMIVEGLVNLLNSHLSLKNYAKAFEYLQKTNPYQEKLTSKLTKANLTYYKACLLMDSPDSVSIRYGFKSHERFNTIEENLLNSEKLYQAENRQVMASKSLQRLSILYEEKGDYVKAYNVFKKYLETREKINQDDLRKKINRKEIQYEFDKKESELIFQQKLTTEQLDKQKLLTTQREQELMLNSQQLRLKTQALNLSNQEKELQRLAYLKEKAEKQEKEQQLNVVQKDKQLQASQLATLVKEKALQIQTLAKKNALIGLLIVSLVGLLLSILAFYLWQRQKTLKQQKENSMNFTKQLLESTEDERKRIASDLHDSVSHELLSLKTMLRGDFSELNSKVDTIINDIRGISRNLHPVMFDKIGLQANIEQLVERTAIQHDFLVSTEMDYKGSLSTSTELQIYRIIQESLTNIIKYANAHAAKISIEEMEDKVCIEIKDNGKGFNVKETLNSSQAFGLHNIIERSRVIGGKATIKSSGEGTVITINVPKSV
jgi:signal transduction histidine kinase